MLSGRNVYTADGARDIAWVVGYARSIAIGMLKACDNPELLNAVTASPSADAELNPLIQFMALRHFNGEVVSALLDRALELGVDLRVEIPSIAADLEARMVSRNG